MEVLYSGSGEYRFMDPDAMRQWVRDNKSRGLANKMVHEQEAIARFVHDGDYVSYDFSSFTRGPLSLFREIIRQRKKDLWLCCKFTLMESGLLAGAGCISRVDVGFMGLGGTISRTVEQGRVAVTEWSNGSLALRHLAGAMGVPFLPSRTLLATDTLKRSGAKVVRDPFTGKSVTLVPAVNPDVALVHVHQCDVYGNARCFGPGVSPLETAMAAKRTIISTDEIIDHEEIRRDPGKTTIPYFLVDAVVYAPFGCYPGGLPGRYELDIDHFTEFLQADRDEAAFAEYLDKYVYSVGSQEEFLARRVGMAKLNELCLNATIKEGYR